MLLALKIILAPLMVAGVTAAARRWGLRVGGILTALPIVGGPTLCFYAIEQGNAFAASAASATLLGIAAIAVFCVVYAHAATRVNCMTALLAACAAFATMAALLYGVRLRGFAELGIAVASLLIARHLLPSSPAVKPANGHPRWDLPLRMMAAAALVLLLTSLASRLGAQLSGMLTAFPVATLVLAVFTHAQRGHQAVASFFRGLLQGLLSFALFCFVFSVALGTFRQNLLAGVTLALLAQFTLQAVILGTSHGDPIS
jgi:hypothetical protein